MEYEEIVEFFLDIYIKEIKKENEVPNINFIFEDEAFILFRRLMEKPLSLINQKDLEYLISCSNDNCLSIKVHDYHLFFNLLTCIVNELINLSRQVNEFISYFTLLRRIWLRMGINDVENIELFLDKQLQFLRNRTFNVQEPTLIKKCDEYDVYMKTSINETWDESTRSMSFILSNEDGDYLLPRILYDIDSLGTCYIYGVQSLNKSKNKNKKIEKKLYKLNDGIENPDVHPSKVMALLLFIEQLEEKGITKIVIPSMQVLSYQYHELLSKEAKRYRGNDPEFYERFYNKQDLISRLKTEDLINLMYRITEHKPNLEIINEVNLQGDCLIIRNNKIKAKTSQTPIRK